MAIEPWRYEPRNQRLARQQQRNTAGTQAALQQAQQGNFAGAASAYRQAASTPAQQLEATAAARTRFQQQLHEIMGRGAKPAQEEQKSGGGFWGSFKSGLDKVTPDILEGPAKAAGSGLLSALEAPQNYLAEPIVGLSQLTAERKKAPDGSYYREKGTFGDLFRGIGQALTSNPVETYSESRQAYQEFFNNPEASVFGLSPSASYFLTEVATDPLTYIAPGAVGRHAVRAPMLRNSRALNMILTGKLSPLGAILEGPGRKAIPFVVGGGTAGSEIASRIETPLSEPFEQILLTLAGATGGGAAATRTMTFGQQIRAANEQGAKPNDYVSLVFRELTAKNIDYESLEVPEELKFRSPYDGVNRVVEAAQIRSNLAGEGAIFRLAEDIPGVAQTARFLRPSRQKLTPEAKQVQTANLAREMYISKQSTVFWGSLYGNPEQPGPLMKIEQVFGSEAVRGGKVENVEFIGPEDLKYRDAPGAEGEVDLSQPRREYEALYTIKDIAERPHLYSLADEQIEAITSIKTRYQAQLAALETDYGVKIPQFEGEGSLAYIPSVDAGTGLDDLLMSAEEAARTGRTETRIFESGYDRAVTQPDFVPQTDLRILMMGSDASKVFSGAEQVFTIGSGGKTHLEVLMETHPKLVETRNNAKTRLASTRAKLRTAQRQISNASAEQAKVATRIKHQSDRFFNTWTKLEDAQLSNAQRKTEAQQALRDIKQLLRMALNEAGASSRVAGREGEQARVAQRGMDSIMQRADRIQKGIDQVQASLDNVQSGRDLRDVVVANFRVFDEEGMASGMTAPYMPAAFKGLDDEYRRLQAELDQLDRSQFRGFEQADERLDEATLSRDMTDILAEEDLKNLAELETEALRIAQEKGEAFSAARVTGLEGGMHEMERTLRQLQAQYDQAAGKVGSKTNYMRNLEVVVKETAEMYHDLVRKVEAANLGDYKFNQNTHRYYKREAAEQVERFTGKQDAGAIAHFLQMWNQSNLSADMSPLTGIQVPMAAFASPVGTLKAVLGSGKRAFVDKDAFFAFKPSALARDISKNTEKYERFAHATNINLASVLPEEFAGGLMAPLLNAPKRVGLPGLGGKYTQAQTGMAVFVTRMMYRMWDDAATSYAKGGVPQEVADLVAGHVVTRMVPRNDAALNGLSRSDAAWQNAAVTSVSFLTRPVEMAEDASRGFLKMMNGYALDPRERLAVTTMTNFIGTVSLISGVSAAYHAHEKGEDPVEAALRAVNPLSGGDWWSMWVPGTNSKVPLGGPFRSLARALMPTYDDPVPGAGLVNFLKVRMSAGIGAQVELAQNRDFFGRPVRADSRIGPQVLTFLQHELSSFAPISIENAWYEAQTGGSIEDVIREFGTGLLGVSAIEESASVQRNRRVRMWAEEVLNKEVAGWSDLLPAEKQEFARTFPDVIERVEKDQEFRAEGGDEFAIKSLAMEAVREELDEQQNYSDAQFLLGQMTAETWLEQRTTRAMEERHKREQIYGDDPITDPKNPVEEYIQVIQQNELATGDVDWDAVNVWLDAQPEAKRTVIQQNTSLGRTPLTRYYQEVVKPVRDAYYNIPKYAGFTADEGQTIDEYIEIVRAEAGGGSDEAKLLRAYNKLEQTGAFADLPDNVRLGLRRAVRYDSRGRRLLRETNAREAFRAANPTYQQWFGADADAPLTPQRMAELQAAVAKYYDEP